MSGNLGVIAWKLFVDKDGDKALIIAPLFNTHYSSVRITDIFTQLRKFNVSYTLKYDTDLVETHLGTDWHEHTQQLDEDGCFSITETITLPEDVFPGCAISTEIVGTKDKQQVGLLIYPSTKDNFADVIG